MGLIIGGVPPQDLIMDGQSVSLYVGGNPPMKVWPTTDVVQITLGTGLQARDQFRAALIERGLEHWTVTEIPFDIEFVGTGSASDMFSDCYELTSVPEMDTSNVTNMNLMFYNCMALTSAPAMDTSNVTSMNSMFYNCSVLAHVPGMDTSDVTDMAWMFYNCSSLTSVPAMNTSQATNMSGMFYYCSSLTNAQGMDTRSVTDMSWMFNGCSSLVSASGLDTSNVTDMSGMFSDCYALTHVSDMVTSSVTGMNYLFTGCAALTDGNVRLIGRHPEVNTTFMIDDSGLTREPWYRADGTPLETVQITLGTGYQARDQFRAALTARGLAYNTVTKIPFDIELVGTGVADHMFDYCGMLTAVPALNTSGVTSMRYMFRDCKNLKEAPAMDTSNVTDMTQMFYKCSSMTYVPDMHTSQARVMGHMLFGCSALTDGNVRLIGKHPQVNTNLMIHQSGLTRQPFYDVVKITLGTGDQARDQLRAALSDRGLDYRTVTEIPFIIESASSGSMRNMFNGCTSLKTVPAMDTSNVTSMASMFASCYALTTVPAMDTSQVTSMSGMFNNCSSLTYVPDMYTSQVTSTSFMFNGCSSLTDGNVRLIGRRPSVNTSNMIHNSGLTREPFYDTNGNPI